MTPESIDGIVSDTGSLFEEYSFKIFGEVKTIWCQTGGK